MSMSVVPSISFSELTAIVDSVAPVVSVVSVTSVSLVPSDVVALASGNPVDDVKSVPSSVETVEMPVDSLALSSIDVPDDDSVFEDVRSEDVSCPK